jgi:hypothetical protein
MPLYLLIVTISNEEEFAAGAQWVHDLIDSGKPREAIAFAQGCEGSSVYVPKLQAFAYVDAGWCLRNQDTLAQGAELWRRVGGESDPAIGYNLAIAESNPWALAVEQVCRHGRWSAGTEATRPGLTRSLT